MNAVVTELPMGNYLHRGVSLGGRGKFLDTTNRRARREETEKVPRKAGMPHGVWWNFKFRLQHSGGWEATTRTKQQSFSSLARLRLLLGLAEPVKGEKNSHSQNRVDKTIGKRVRLEQAKKEMWNAHLENFSSGEAKIAFSRHNAGSDRVCVARVSPALVAGFLFRNQMQLGHVRMQFYLLAKDGI